MRSANLTNVFVIGITGALVAIVVLPLCFVVGAAFVSPELLGLAPDQWTADDGAFSLGGVRYILATYGPWLSFSLQIALASVILCLVVAVPAGYSLVRYPFPGSRLIEELVLLPLSLPGISMSIALLAAYGWMRGQWLVLGGHLLYTLPFMLRVTTNALRAQDVAALEMAARSLGAGFWQRLWLVVLPSLRHAMIVGALLVFTVSWGEFNVSFLLNRGHPQTFPAALYNTYANESLHRSSAATAVFLAGAVPAILCIQLLGGRASQDVEHGA